MAEEIFYGNAAAANDDGLIRVESVAEKGQTFVRRAMAAFDLDGNRFSSPVQHKIDLVVILAPIVQPIVPFVGMIDEVRADGRFHPSPPPFRVGELLFKRASVHNGQQRAVVNLQLGNAVVFPCLVCRVFPQSRKHVAFVDDEQML